jgi:glutamate racemase
MNTKSIGIFDSGFGGLTVMKAITELLPQENIIYFGDTAHLPYGNKSPETLLKYSMQNVQFLAEQEIKLLVIACHSACTAALPALESHFSFPIVGVTHPGVEELVHHSKTGNLGLLGTKATIESGAYQKMVLQRLPKANLSAVACPLFVPLVETGYLRNPLITKNIVSEHLHLLKEKPLDAVLLACTHYPLLQEQIQEELGDLVLLIDPAAACAKKVQKTLEDLDLQNYESSSAQYLFYVSDDPLQFQTIGQSFFPLPIEAVHLSENALQKNL